VAAIHVAGVRGDPCGAVRWTHRTRMLISMLKYIKTLRHVSILTDHHQGVSLYLVKVTELFKKH